MSSSYIKTEFVPTWSTAIRMVLLCLIMYYASCATSNEHNYEFLKLEGDNKFSRIWFCASVCTTIIFSIWINYTIASDKRLVIPKFANLHGLIYLLFAITLIFSVGVVISIYSNYVKKLNLITLFCGPILVTLIVFFDGLVLSMEKRLSKENNEITINVNLHNAHSTFFYIDIPIFFSVWFTWLISSYWIGPFTGNFKIFDKIFDPAFSAGATSLQIILANVAFEAIHSINLSVLPTGDTD